MHKLTLEKESNKKRYFKTMGVALALFLGLKKEKKCRELNIRTPVLKMFLYIQMLNSVDCRS